MPKSNGEIPKVIRAVQLNAYDGADASLVYVEKLLPELKSGQVLVKIAASPINPSDLMFVRGMYGVKKALPVVPGFEASGTVMASGGGLPGRALVGLRVACSSDDGDGTWADYMITTPSHCMPLLPEIGMEQGAMLIVNPLSAWCLVEKARKGNHACIVQSAAASALGRMVVRLTAKQKMGCISIVRKPAQVELLKAMGAEDVLNSEDSDFDEKLRALCRQKKATFGIDAVAGVTTGRMLHAMPRGSSVVVYGALSEKGCVIEPGDLIFSGKSIEGFWLTNMFAAEKLPELLQGALRVQQWLAHEFKSEVRARYPLTDGAKALDAYKNDMTGGKVLFVP